MADKENILFQQIKKKYLHNEEPVIGKTSHGTGENGTVVKTTRCS